MARWPRRKGGGRASAVGSRGSRLWDLGVECQTRFVVHEICRLPREWVACSALIRNKGEVVGALSARCEHGSANFDGRSVDFSTSLVLDTEAGDFKKQVRFGCW